MQRPPFDRDRELAELREYLGDRYDERRLRDYEAEVDREYAELGSEDELYRRSQAYLYNLTAFAMSGTKLAYLELLEKHVPRGSRLLDYGCGIGSDGLWLLERGYRVTFADFANPSTEYLRWRLERRGHEAAIHDLDSDPPPAGFDLAYAFDVIEHVEDPFGFLRQLEERARLVLVNFLDPEPGETEIHHELPVADLLAHAAGRRLRAYRRFYERSHVVLYEPGAKGGPGAKAKLALGRLRGDGPDYRY